MTRIILPVFALLLTACSTAFEVGEALNKATSNIASDPSRYLWSTAPASTEATKPAAPASPEQSPVSSVPSTAPQDIHALPQQDAK